MSETRKRCPNGENYNKETKRCEPKGEMTQRVSTAKTARSKTAKSSSPTTKSSSPKSSSPKSSSPKSTSPRAKTAKATSARATSPRAKTARASASSSIIEPFILHEGADSYRLLVSVPINNPALWPNPNICYFRTSGRSNKNSEIFTGTWFPIAGIKDSSTMPEYLVDKVDGFLIKMAFIMNKSDVFSGTDKQPKWISDLIDDYPIILEESEKSWFDNKSSISIVEFIEFIKINKYKPNTTIIDTRYERIANETDKVLNDGFTKFLNYFLYEWQAMLSLRIGGGYWDLNSNFAQYISRKLHSFDLVPVPHINPALKRIDEKELKIIYESDPNNNKETNRGQPTINFSKDAGTQLSITQIDEIKKEEEKKLSSTGKSTSQIINFSVMERKYLMPIMQFLESVKREKRFSKMFGTKP